MEYSPDLVALDGGQRVVVVVQVAEEQQTVYPLDVHGELVAGRQIVIRRFVELLSVVVGVFLSFFGVFLPFFGVFLPFLVVFFPFFGGFMPFFGQVSSGFYEHKLQVRGGQFCAELAEKEQGKRGRRVGKFGAIWLQFGCERERERKSGQFALFPWCNKGRSLARKRGQKDVLAGRAIYLAGRAKWECVFFE